MADKQYCTAERPDYDGYHDLTKVEMIRDLPGYRQWWCPNCGAQVTEAGHD